MIKSNEFFELLVSDDKDKIHEFIMANGKAPKPICPIRFISNKEENETEGDDSNG